MTKKDYILIAQEVKACVLAARNLPDESAGKPIAVGTLENLTYRLANRLKSANSAFNRDMFLIACGVDVP